MKSPRILHVDADNFFASCEEILSPTLRGRAVIVSGGRRQNGCVLSANRRAKQLGIKSGMACFMAWRLRADLVCCPARVLDYQVISARLFSVLNRFSPLVAPVSVDDGVLDLRTEADDATRGRVLRKRFALTYVPGPRIWEN